MIEIPKEILDLQGVIDSGSSNRVIQFLAENNDEKYIYTKLAEELNELSEICLKRANKKPVNWPSESSLIEEMGDVSIRLDMLIVRLEIDTVKIEDRIKYKVGKYLEYLKQGKYNGGI